MRDSPAVPAAEPLGPVTSAKRVTLIDALRGFVLAGVLLANLPAFSGYYFLGPEASAALAMSAADS